MGIAVPFIVGFGFQIFVALAEYCFFSRPLFIAGVLISNMTTTFTTPYVQSVLASLDGTGRASAFSGAAANFGAAIGPALGALLIGRTVAPIGITSSIMFFVGLGLALSSLRSVPLGSTVEACSMKSTPTLECVWEARAELAESTIWVDEERALYFVDGLAGRLMRYSESEGPSEVYRHGGVIGFIAQRVDGGFIAGMDNKLYKLDPVLGLATEVGCPEPELPHSQFNDGKVDRRGGLWAGTLDRDCEQPVGSLYHITKDLRWRAVDDGYLCTNGPAFSPDGRILYHTDSMRRTIYQFDLDLDSGAIANKRVFVQIDEEAGLPDGMTVDCDGRLWVAHFGGARVTAFKPNGTVSIQSFTYPRLTSRPARSVVANGATLFISTSRTWMTEAQLRESPLAGSLFAC